MEFLSEFLTTIVIVSITAGIVTTLGGGRRGMDKFIKYAASLTILSVLLSPFAEVDFSKIGDDISSYLQEQQEELGADISEYKQRISKYSAKALEEHTKSDIAKKTKLSENAFEVKFILEYISEDELDISEIKVELYTISAVVFRDKIEDYIIDKFGDVKYSFTESVN